MKKKLVFIILLEVVLLIGLLFGLKIFIVDKDFADTNIVGKDVKYEISEQEFLSIMKDKGMREISIFDTDESLLEAYGCLRYISALSPEPYADYVPYYEVYYMYCESESKATAALNTFIADYNMSYYDEDNPALSDPKQSYKTDYKKGDNYEWCLMEGGYINGDITIGGVGYTHIEAYRVGNTVVCLRAYNDYSIPEAVEFFSQLVSEPSAK